MKKYTLKYTFTYTMQTESDDYHDGVTKEEIEEIEKGNAAEILDEALCMGDGTITLVVEESE